MKKVYSLLFVSICAINLTFGQQKEIIKVADCAEKLRLAMIDPSKDLLESLVVDSLTYGHSGGHIDDKIEFMDKLLSGKSDFVRITISNQTITIIGKTAILRHSFFADTNDKNIPGSVKLYVLQVWVKEKNHWKLAARQAVKVN